MRLSAVVLLFLVVSAPALAAEPDNSTAPFDRGYERVGNVSLNGTTYEVYRYENVLPYASGYEFYGDRRIEEADRAKRVARAYAWNTALREQIDEEETENLRGVGETAEAAQTVVAAPLRVVNTTLDLIEGTQEGRGGSVWQIAVSAVPELRGATTTLRATRDELLRWEERVKKASEDVIRFADEAEAVRSGREAEYGELPNLSEDAVEGLRDAEKASSTVSNSLGEVANSTGEIGERISGVRLVGDDLATPFRRLSSSLENSTKAVERFESSAAEGRKTVETVRGEAVSDENELRTGWRRRQTAALRVYGTGAIVVLTLALGGYVYRRKRPDE
jgi:hypothetical protein